MTVEEAKKSKWKLETLINSLLRNFHQETGLNVSGISLDRREVSTFGDVAEGQRKYLLSVTIEVEV